MEIFTIISLIAISTATVAMLVPVTLCWVIALNAPPTMAVSIRLLIFKTTFAIKSSKAKTESKSNHKQAHKKLLTRPDHSGMGLFSICMRERQTVIHVIRVVVSFVKNLLLCVDRYFVDLNVKGALPSPYLTGQLYGLVSAVKGVPSDSLLLSFRPDFTKDRLQGQIAVGTTFRGYKIFREVLYFIGGLPKLKLIRLYRTYRKESANV